MKKVYCDDKVSVWQQGDIFVGTAADSRPKASDFNPGGTRQFNNVNDAADQARRVCNMAAEFAKSMGW